MGMTFEMIIGKVKYLSWTNICDWLIVLTRVDILEKVTSTLYLFLPSLGLNQIVGKLIIPSDLCICCRFCTNFRLSGSRILLHWVLIDVVPYVILPLLPHNLKNHCHWCHLFMTKPMQKSKNYTCGWVCSNSGRLHYISKLALLPTIPTIHANKKKYAIYLWCPSTHKTQSQDNWHSYRVVSNV